MANNVGTLVTAPVRPVNELDTFPSAVANEILGGFHTADTMIGRDAIPADRRTIGMVCYVIENKMTYILVGGIDNTNWAEYNASETNNGMISSADYAKLKNISSSATKVETSTTNGNILIDGVESVVYRHQTFIHDQVTALDTWVITHNLNRFPTPTIVDSGGSVVIGDVTYNDVNTLTLTFSAAFSGKAYLN